MTTERVLAIYPPAIPVIRIKTGVIIIASTDAALSGHRLFIAEGDSDGDLIATFRRNGDHQRHVNSIVRIDQAIDTVSLSISKILHIADDHRADLLQLIFLILQAPVKRKMCQELQRP